MTYEYPLMKPQTIVSTFADRRISIRFPLRITGVETCTRLARHYRRSRKSDMLFSDGWVWGSRVVLSR